MVRVIANGGDVRGALPSDTKIWEGGEKNREGKEGEKERKKTEREKERKEREG